MICKGNVSTVDKIVKKARVILPELNDRISSELTIAHYVGEVKVNDVVVVSFYNDDVSDGIIIANLSTNFNSEPQISKLTYIHTQIVAKDTWSIKHDLNKYPNVAVVDSAGSVVIGDVNYVSENEIRIMFSAPFSGKAYLN